jgi:membrane fusion protein (multidrug efflux system)
LPRWITLAGLVPALLGSLAGCGADDTQASVKGPEGTASEADAKDESVPVEIAALERGAIEEVLRFSTNLEAEQSVEVYSQAARRVEQLAVEEGDRVAKGQVLVRLQDDEQQNQLAKTQGQLAKARREYERQQNLWAEKLIPEQDFNNATYELEQLQLGIEEAERQLSYTVVRAPIAGTITHRLVNLGDHVTVNQHLFDIVDFDSLVARVYVPEKELSKLSVGLPARIVAPALGGAYRGVIERLAPVVDARSGTVKVTVDIPDWQGLRPGLYVDVELVTDTRDDALLVPKRALVYDRDQVFVYRVTDGAGDAGPTVERVPVEAALEDQGFVQPAGEALAPGDRLVIAGQAGLKNGTKVRVLGVEQGT